MRASAWHTAACTSHHPPQLTRATLVRRAPRRCLTWAIVAATQVCNEPSKEIPPHALVEHYIAAARAVREGGMSMDRVAVICPLYYTDDDDKDEFLKAWLEGFEALDNCVLDIHPYYFGDWSNADVAGPLMKQARHRRYGRCSRYSHCSRTDLFE